MFPPSRIEIPRDSTLADTYSIPFAVDYTVSYATARIPQTKATQIASHMQAKSYLGGLATSY
jgi:hypothetical protein